MENYQKATGLDPALARSDIARRPPAAGRNGVIKEVVDENQSLDQREGDRLQGLHPGGLRAAGDRAAAEEGRDRGRDQGHGAARARPQPQIQARRLGEDRSSKASSWRPTGPAARSFYQAQPNQGRDAFRVMVPEYYAKSCLSCHGKPKGEVDITGYPKEGASEGDLGGVISITLLQPAAMTTTSRTARQCDDRHVPALHHRPPGAASRPRC